MSRQAAQTDDRFIDCLLVARSFRIVRMLCVALFLAPMVSTAGETVYVTEISGRKTTGPLVSWSNDMLKLGGDEARELTRPEIRSVDFKHDVQKKPGGQSMIWLSNGDRISARPVRIADDALTLDWPALGSRNEIKTPLEKIAAAIIELPMTVTERLRLFADLRTLPPEGDLVMLTNGDRLTGEIQRLDDAFAVIKVAANSLSLDRSRVRAIRFDPELTNATRSKGRRVILALTDGSRITAINLAVSGEILTVNSPQLGSIDLPLKSICACHFFGERVIPITDYEPAKTEFTPFLSSQWTYARDSNALHGPLTLRGTEFVTGLGMYSRMSVTYDLRGQERVFQSVVGIDDIANGAGSAVFAVQLDGGTVWSSSDLTGKTPAMATPEIDLRGRKTITLVVDYGQFADVSDYADWCDAVLILEPIR